MNKHPDHRTYMPLYKHEYTNNNNKFKHCYFLYRKECLHINAEYTKFAVCLEKLDKRKPVESESDMFSIQILY